MSHSCCIIEVCVAEECLWNRIMERERDNRYRMTHRLHPKPWPERHFVLFEDMHDDPQPRVWERSGMGGKHKDTVNYELFSQLTGLRKTTKHFRLFVHARNRKYNGKRTISNL